MGRRRKHRYRYKSGRGKPERPKGVEEHVRIARAQPHRRELRSNDRTSELAESVLGRLKLRGVITAGELAAGEAFAGIVARYRRVIEGPRPVRTLMPEVAPERADSEDLVVERFDCPVAHLDPIERGVVIGGVKVATFAWPCQLPGQICPCRDRRRRYERLYEAIAGAGRRALMAVVRALRNEDLPAAEIVYLRAGLSAARRELGLTDGADGA